LQPARLAFLSLSLSLLSPCSPPTWSINTCYRPAGSRPKGERHTEREKEREGVRPRERETKNKDPKKIRLKGGAARELSSAFAEGYQYNAPDYLYNISTIIYSM